MYRCLEIRGYVKKTCTSRGKRGALPKMHVNMWYNAGGTVAGGLKVGVKTGGCKNNTKEKPNEIKCTHPIP